jgi:RNA polymerase sigma-70 factor (ECF subfamily)
MEQPDQTGGLCGERQFRAAFDAHYKLLRNFLVFRFGDSEKAEDATQQAFVALWENCGKILPVQARRFLFTTAVRQSINIIRHDRVAENFRLRLDSDGHAEAPDELLEEKELRCRLESAIGALPEKQRTVFLMNRMESQTYAEIADLLGLSVKAVEKRMHQALLSLRNVISMI